jgi:hypothetical protein
LNFAGTGYRRKEDCVAQNNGQTPARKTAEADPILANGEPKEKREWQSRSEKSLKKEESKEKDPPNPKVAEKFPER